MNLSQLSIIIGIVIILTGAAVVWSSSRRYRRDLGLYKEEREKTSESAFIIKAFHDVNKQLKEKERELQRLKALAEQRAENVENYNENILQCVTSGVMSFDRDCRVTTSNRAAQEMLGGKTGQNGMTCQDVFGTGAITEAVRETIERKMPSARMEQMLDRPQGKLWLGFNTAVLTDRPGEAIGAILSFSDLTEIKRLQEQMELHERLTALGEMSAGIAHELRNPMAVITGYLNLLSKRTDPASRTIIHDITTEINGMNRIIGDLLTFARPASLNRVRVKIKDMIEGCLAGVLQVTGADAQFKTVLHLGEMEAFVDEVLMRQAFTNLLQNALEAMPDGGTLTVEIQDGDPRLLKVSDTGIGIPDDAVKKVFLPFFTTKDKGVGLGLALVHKIVLSHGGTIAVSSRKGKGTTFTVTLPSN